MEKWKKWKSKLNVQRAAAIVFALTLVTSGSSLWAQSPASQKPAATEPAPRWPDGRINLGSSKDQTGYWEIRPGLGGFPRAADVPFQDWSRALYQYRTTTADLYPPLVGCKPAGGPGFFNAPGFEIVDSSELKSIFLLNIAGPHSWRVVYMDGRPHPPRERLRPTYFGHSIGKWEGDTLVIDSVGFTDESWLAWPGYFHTNNMRVVERVRRDGNTLTWQATIHDPEVLMQPWEMTPVRRQLNANPKALLVEDLPCEDRDQEHIATRERG